MVSLASGVTTRSSGVLVGGEASVPSRPEELHGAEGEEEGGLALRLEAGQRLPVERLLAEQRPNATRRRA